MDPAKWGACYFDHYEAFLGSISGHIIAEPTFDGPKLQLLSYDDVFSGCVVFCTLGLTHYRHILGGPWEVFFAVDRYSDTAARVITDALFYLIDGQHPLIRGVNVSGFEAEYPSFAEDIGKSAVYFTELHGLPKGFCCVECDGATGYILQAIFISASEAEHLRRVGADAFETAMESAQVDPFDLSRPSFVE